MSRSNKPIVPIPELAHTGPVVDWEAEQRWLRRYVRALAKRPTVEQLHALLVRKCPVALPEVIFGALLGLDVLLSTPLLGDVEWRTLPLSSWWRAAIYVGLLIVFAIWRKLVRLAHGPVVRIEVQAQRTPPLHKVGARRVTRGRKELSGIGERFSLGADGVVDIRNLLARASSGLNAISDDRIDFLPDVLMPAGLALGYDWNVRPGSRWNEVNGDKRGWNWFDYWFTSVMGVAEDVEPVPDSSLAAVPESQDVKSVCVNLLLTVPRGKRPRSAKTPRGTVPGSVPPSSSPHRPVDSGGAPDGISGTFDRVITVGAIRRDHVSCFVGCRSASRRRRKDRGNHLARVLAFETGPGALAKRCQHDPGDIESVITPAEAVIGAGRAIRHALVAYPNAKVVVTGRIPKSVSIPLGWYLANASPDTAPGVINDPWERLVPLGFLGHPNGALRPMWVYPDQPDPAVVLQEIGIFCDHPEARS